MINNVTNTPVDLFKTANKSDKKDLNPLQGNNEESNKDKGEKVTIGNDKAQEVTYSKNLESSKISVKFAMNEQIISSLTLSQGAVGGIGGDSKSQQSINELVTERFKTLGLSTTIDVGNGKTADLQSMTPEEAQKLIADDGYWGVEQTSNRIVDFAAAQIGNDPSKLEKIKEAVMNGFDSAKKAWGGQLPDISQKTIDAVMSKLDKLGKPEASE